MELPPLPLAHKGREVLGLLEGLHALCSSYISAVSEDTIIDIAKDGLVCGQDPDEGSNVCRFQFHTTVPIQLITM